MAEPLTILIIDDSETDQQLCSRALRATGHVLVAAFNAGDGVAKAGELKPDVILLDYQLPDLDGLAVLKRIAKPSAAYPPVVMLTGAGDETVAVEAMKAGASDYLVKDTRGDYLKELPRVIRRARASFEERSRARRLDALNSAILATVADGILGLDGEGGILFANPAAERMLLAPSGSLVGRHFAELLRKTGPQETWQSHPLSEVHGGTAAVYRECDCFERSDGTSFPAAYNASPLDFEESGHFGWVLAFQDITVRKAAEDQLRRRGDELELMVQKRTADLVLARDVAEAASKTKSVFLANVSHELRTPLNAILGFSAMLCSDPQTTKEQRERLAIINRNGEDLLTLVNDILEITRIEAGRMDLDIAAFDLDAMVREVADMMRLRTKEVGLDLYVVRPSAGLHYLRADGGRLRQILVNLADNAVKFTKAGSITIRTSVTQNGQPHLVMEVEDTGPGIPPEERKRIFRPFEQLGEAGTQEGAGLGLVITRQFVELMGGTISVTSEAGSGSVFRVVVPVELADAVAVAEGWPAGAGEVTGLAPGTPRYRILIAEDQPENQLIMQQLMERIGLDVKVVPDGEACVKLFQDWHPHLIWMDRRMPGMDGVSAARLIRKLPGGADVKIVAATASVFKEQRQEMLDAGMDGLVCKPYRFREIYSCLAKLLGVEYVYSTPAPEAALARAELTPEMLAVLPAPLLKHLKEALESLDSHRIGAIIGEVSKADQQLGQTLRQLADDFNYPEILRTLSAASPVASDPGGCRWTPKALVRHSNT